MQSPVPSKFLTFLFAFIMLPVLADSQTEKNVTEFSFGIVPQQSATTLARNWGPIFSYLSEETGLTLRFRTASNIPTFEAKLASGEYDFAYMNPFHYVTYNRNPGYIAFANQAEKKIKGILIKSRESKISSLQDLNGETLAFPSPAAFAASMLPRGELKKLAVDFKPKYVGSHDSVYRAVAKGIYPAGGGIERTFNTLDPDIKSQLEIFWTSSAYTPHAFAAHPRVSPDIVDRVMQAMLKMQQDPEASKLLARLKFKGIQSASDSEWDDVRSLDLMPIKNAITQ